MSDQPDDYPGAVYCGGKVRHPSRTVAEQNLARLTRRFDRSGKDRKERGLLMAYHCDLCHGFHLGNWSPENIRAEKAKRGRR